MVGGISLVNRRSRLGEDTGVGLLFVGMLALGVIIISKSRSFTTDVQSLLFGDILGVTWGDVRLQAGAAVLVLALSALGYRAFLVLSFNEAKSASLGLRPGVTHLALLALIAVSIVASFQAVGTLLVFGLLVGPPATAALLVRRVWLCMVFGVVLGWVSVVLGLVLSYHYGTAAGATMAGLSVALFFVVLLGAGAGAVGATDGPRRAGAASTGTPTPEAGGARAVPGCADRRRGMAAWATIVRGSGEDQCDRHRGQRRGRVRRGGGARSARTSSTTARWARPTSVYVGGKKVVDLWGGVADVATGAPYTEDSLQLVFSTTKGATAACVNLLAQRGDLDIDAPVATYWPEFKAAGKGDIPVRWLLCHKAGLPYVDGTMTLDEALAWDPVIRALEAQAPVWEPGTAHGYHATTYGWLLGEVVRRVSGKSHRHVLRRRVRGAPRPRLLDRPARRRAAPGGAAHHDGRARRTRPCGS